VRRPGAGGRAGAGDHHRAAGARDAEELEMADMMNSQAYAGLLSGANPAASSSPMGMMAQAQAMARLNPQAADAQMAQSRAMLPAGSPDVPARQIMGELPPDAIATMGPSMVKGHHGRGKR
jgi:hypothetical protein